MASCTEKTQKSNEKFIDQILNVTTETSTKEYVELPELYDTICKNIPKPEIDTPILVKKLKTKGFKIMDWGWGNYPPLGPRIVRVSLKKADCECEVDKIYYATTEDTIYQMSERIKCTRAIH